MVQGAAFRILACFYGVEVLGFAELCKQAGYPTDLGGYYIRQLIGSGHMEKVDRGQYRLLPKGKQEVALHYGKHAFAPQPRLAVLFIARQGDSFVAMRRQKQPFIGVLEWPAGMVSGGEELAAACKRIMTARFGLETEARLAGLFRRIDTYDDMLFDDKLFAVHVCELPADAVLQAQADTGENGCYTAAELQAADKRSRALLDIFHFAETGEAYTERTYALDAADLSLDEATTASL